MANEARSVEEMAVTAVETTPVDSVVAWIGSEPESAMSVLKLYNSGPDHFGVSDVEFREFVNEGIRQGRLAIAGLADRIRVLQELQSAASK